MKRGALSVPFIYSCQDKDQTSLQKEGFRTDSLNGFDCISVDLSCRDFSGISLNSLSLSLSF